MQNVANQETMANLEVRLKDMESKVSKRISKACIFGGKS